MNTAPIKSQRQALQLATQYVGTVSRRSSSEYTVTLPWRAEDPKGPAYVASHATRAQALRHRSCALALVALRLMHGSSVVRCAEIFMTADDMSQKVRACDLLARALALPKGDDK